MKNIFWLCFLIGFSVQAEASSRLTNVVQGHLSDDIYAAVITDKNIKLCTGTENNELSEITKKKIGGYALGDEQQAEFIAEFIETVKITCSLLKKDSFKDVDVISKVISYAVAEGNKAVTVQTPQEKELAHISEQVKDLAAIIKKGEKKIIISEEVEQLEYMILGSSITTFCEYKNKFERKAESICGTDDKKCLEKVVEAYKQICKNNGYDLPDINKRITVLGDTFYNSLKEQSRFHALKDQKEKVNDLRTKLGHKNWKSDMYWVGASVMNVPHKHVMTTGVALHVYLGYSRAIQTKLLNAHEFGRRFSVYFDVGNASSNNTFSGTTYGVGLGFDIREGFILKLGGTYLKAVSDGAYAYNNTVGISITSEFFKELMGKGEE